MFREHKLRGTSGILLSAGVALGIVLSAGVSAPAADLPVFVKAKGPERGLFRWTLEAGAFWTGGAPPGSSTAYRSWGKSRASEPSRPRR